MASYRVVSHLERYITNKVSRFFMEKKVTVSVKVKTFKGVIQIEINSPELTLLAIRRQPDLRRFLSRLPVITEKYFNQPVTLIETRNRKLTSQKPFYFDPASQRFRWWYERP